MAMNEFWNSVRIGASRILSPKVVVESPRLDPALFEAAFGTADMWLTPNCVEGFDPVDFAFLPDDERQKLEQHVKSFIEIAQQVPPDGPATKEQRKQAIGHFTEIILQLRFDRFGDWEAYQIGKQIEQAIAAHRPAELAELRFNTGLDNTGDPAVWIWAILSDEGADESVFAQNTTSIHKILAAAARRACPNRWPYIRFRSMSEQNEYAEAVAS